MAARTKYTNGDTLFRELHLVHSALCYRSGLDTVGHSKSAARYSYARTIADRRLAAVGITCYTTPAFLCDDPPPLHRPSRAADLVAFRDSVTGTRASAGLTLSGR